MPSLFLSGPTEWMLYRSRRLDLPTVSIRPGDPLPQTGPEDILIVGNGPDPGRTQAEAAIRNGSRVWLDRPDLWSLADFRSLLALSEESGVETAVSRPWRSACTSDPERCRLVRIETRPADIYTEALGAAIDAATWLCATHTIQRVDAERLSDASGRPVALLATLRFQNSALVHISIVVDSSDPDTPAPDSDELAPARSYCRISGGGPGTGWRDIAQFDPSLVDDTDILLAFCHGREDDRRAHLAEAESARTIEEKVYAVLRGA